MANIKSKISTYNKKILNKLINQNTRKCNCINKNNCPLIGNCVLENILYIATMVYNKKNYKPEIGKELVKTHSKKDTQTIKDYSVSIDINTIPSYPSRTGN